MKRDVSAHLVLSVREPATRVFSVATAADYRPAERNCDFKQDGAAVEATEVLDLI